MSGSKRWIRAGTVLVLCLLAGLAGCGKKDWPSPRAEEDRFTWAGVNGTRQNGCLVARAELQGAYWNLASVRLEIETLAEPCPGCPFQPTRTVEFPPGSASVTQERELIRVSFCELDQEGFTRWRLAGLNRYSQLEDVTSQVMILE